MFHLKKKETRKLWTSSPVKKNLKLLTTPVTQIISQGLNPHVIAHFCMAFTTYPELTYEEYFHAAAHFTCRIDRLVELGTVPIDQFIVKWYLMSVLKCDASQKKAIAFLHKKYFGVIQKMIYDGVLTVLDSKSLGKHTFRVLHVHPQLCPQALWLSCMMLHDKQQNKGGAISGNLPG